MRNDFGKIGFLAVLFLTDVAIVRRKIGSVNQRELSVETSAAPSAFIRFRRDKPWLGNFLNEQTHG
jgi:hypothetical protein